MSVCVCVWPRNTEIAASVCVFFGRAGGEGNEREWGNDDNPHSDLFTQSDCSEQVNCAAGVKSAEQISVRKVSAILLI